MKKKKPTPLEQVNGLLEEYSRLEHRAETLIEEHISGLVSTAPGIPRTSLRQMTFDSRAQGYSHPLALRYLRKKLERGS